MSTLPELTESDVRAWCGESYFGRALGYYRNGNTIHPRRQDDTLKAQSLGSRPQPYDVQVTLGPAGIVSGHCSCPVGGGGHCKHAGALLLTWVHDPDEFLVQEDLDAALDRRSKAELIALIRKMIDRYPDLETLLELATLGDPDAEKPLDSETIRRHVSRAFQGAGYDDWGYGGAYYVSSDLEEVLDLADDYTERGDWQNAATIYRVVADEILSNYEMVYDEEGELGNVVNQCVEGLGHCLENLREPITREVTLRALFDIYSWDVGYGGIDVGYAAPDIILQEATPEERQQVIKWINANMPAGTDSWKRRAYGGFLLSLQEEDLDDEAFLQICRDTGRRHDLVDKLLELDRIEEAVEETREVSSHELVSLANLFLAHGHPAVAEDSVREQLQSSQDTRLTTWLIQRARDRNDFEEALDLTRDLFKQHPALRRYQEIRELAQQLDRWDDVRLSLLHRLDQQGQHTLLVEIHLDEGEVGQAIETLEQAKQSSNRTWAWSWPNLEIRVAAAAEQSHPEDAWRIYMARVEQLINARGRDNYAAAAGYLQRVRDIYHRLGDEEVWQDLISELRQQHSNLPALKDELNKAGL